MPLQGIFLFQKKVKKEVTSKMPVPQRKILVISLYFLPFPFFPPDKEPKVSE
jgi:hypothetical protein